MLLVSTSLTVYKYTDTINYVMTFQQSWNHWYKSVFASPLSDIVSSKVLEQILNVRAYDKSNFIGSLNRQQRRHKWALIKFILKVEKRLS